MKKSIIMSFVLFLAVLGIFGIASAATTCNPQISLINQDPYPAIPGDYVKVVFQISGLENPSCGTITFGINEKYPVHLYDPATQNPITVNPGTFQKDFSSSIQEPYKLILDENTLNGENPIEIYYSSGSAIITKDFNITVQDTRADFEINVKNYDYITRVLTFEILNTAKVDVKALRLDIPKQEGIEVKGANNVIVGDLDSHEYTTADFEVILPKGETSINLNVNYIDTVGVGRSIQKVVGFDSSYFTNRDVQKKTPWFWIILVIVIIAFFVWRRIKKKKREKERMKKRGMVQ